jgi:hypothetical protein
MRNTNTLKKVVAFVAILFTIAIGCKRTEIPVTPEPIPTNPVGGPVNDAAQVMASVSGIVLDESNVPVANAVVTSGTATTTTNSNGMFIFQNISLSKENGSITAVKAGYFKGIRSFKTTEGKNHNVRLQLMQRVLSGTVNAASGGTITTNGGATIVFPANAFVTITGATYTGVVSVYSRWIDPTAANLPFVIPGDLRGVSTTGVENILETYGMVGAELADASGNVLKIATGKTATVSFPIPASLSATAPASIVLWHFDDATARWKENGTATKNGNTYTAQVDKFSFWNVDVPNTNFINLDYTLINATTNSPLASTSTRIKRANGSYGYGITNNAGFVSGLVPKNEVFVLEVVSECNTVIYAQNIGPFAANTSLGNIIVTIPPSQYITFTGILINCSSAPVTNGYVSLAATGGYGSFGNTNSTGAFSFSVLNCSSINVTYNYQGTDNTTTQQSAVLTGSAINGTINLGNISACGTVSSADVYVAGEENGFAKIWRNGLPINLSNASDTSAALSVFVSGSDVHAVGYDKAVAKYWRNGVATNLTNGLSEVHALSVFVSGADVYIAGYEIDSFIINSNLNAVGKAKFWKNGILTNLTNGINGFGSANSVFISGNDIYVGGVVSNYSTDSNFRAVIWKNGILTNLTNGITTDAQVNSINVSGVDVYAAGYIADSANGSIRKAVFWKNGTPTFLTNGNGNAEASSIFIAGNDIYVVGHERLQFSFNSIAKVWKNGTLTNLSLGNDRRIASSIYVKNSEAFIAGYSFDWPIPNGVVWKDGIPTSFFNLTNNVSAYSIFVK